MKKYGKKRQNRNINKKKEQTNRGKGREIGDTLRRVKVTDRSYNNNRDQGKNREILPLLPIKDQIGIKFKKVTKH
jgi:hypothetical protein